MKRSAALRPDAFARLTAAASQGQARNARVWTWVAAVFIALFLLPTLWFPLHRDAGTFALGGLAVVRGETLYRDFWDNKPPAIFWTYALPARLFPSQLVGAIYALNALVLALSAGLLARLMRLMGRESAASGAALWLVVLTLQPGFSNLAQAETFANCAVLGAALWAVAPPDQNIRRRIFTALGAGALAGIAVLFKPTCVLPLLPFLGWHRRDLRTLAMVIIGGALPLLLAFLSLRAGGGWAAYLEIQREFLAPYLRSFTPSFADHALGLLAYAALWSATLWLPAIGAVLALLDRDAGARRAHGFLLLSFGGGFLALWMQNRSFAYQWTPMLPFFAALAAAGLASIGEKLGLAGRKSIALCVLLPLFWGAWRAVPSYRNLLQWRLGTRTHAAYLASFQTLDEAKSPSALPAAFATARFIRARTSRADTLFVFAFEPEIYLESGRRAPNRFYLHPPLIATFAPAEWRVEAWRSLKKTPPRFIVLANGDDNRWIGAPRGDSRALWRKTAIFPWFAAHYQLAARFGRFETYRFAG